MKPTHQKRRKHMRLLAATIVAVVLACILLWHRTAAHDESRNVFPPPAAAKKSTAAKLKPSTTPKPAPTVCTGNALAREAVVSISKRHLWACEGTKLVYGSPVVTGVENLPADLTPTGIYHIYSKQTELYLNGSDSTGSWHDYVHYWMPWLSNKYGVYGFHDATWRKDSDFGHISPYSSGASHGCVELPLATAKWLYGWARIGTTVAIKA